MELKDFFYGIEDFMVNVAFAPLDWLRQFQLESWFLANSINWIFVVIMAVAFCFWVFKLNIFEEDERDYYAEAHRDSGKSIEFFVGDEKAAH
ncbi:MAG: uracil phosphoribosyltransferase [Leeuwenhoekiella sp.]